MADKQGKSELIGEGVPGTGGDFIDPNDTEGHVRFADDAPDGPRPVRGLGEDGDGRSRAKLVDGEDVEGHLYRTGPTTSGDFAKRAPGNNPHGER
jgi:hypothetical protein